MRLLSSLLGLSLAYLPVCGFAQSAVPPIVRYHFGDNPAWANPKFDDSTWPVAPDGKWPFPAPNSDGFLWIRVRIPVPPSARVPQLAPPAILVGGSTGSEFIQFAAADEINVNGTLVGRRGSLPPRADPILIGHEVVFDLPSELVQPANSALVAYRAWYPPSARSVTIPNDTHFQIDDSLRLRSRAEANRFKAIVAIGPGVAMNCIVIALTGFLLFLWRKTRGRVLLNCSIWLLSTSPMLLLLELASSGALPIGDYWYLLVLWIMSVVGMGFTLEMVCSLFGLYGTPIHRIYFAAWVARSCANAVGVIAPPATALALWGVKASFPLIYIYCGVQIAICTWQFFVRRRHRLICIAIVIFTVVVPLDMAGMLPSLAVGPLRFSVVELSFFFSELAVFVMLGGQGWREWRAREELRSEFDAAREVQERLVPPAIDIPGFAIQSVYRPAKDVGGDFFFVRAGHGGAYQDNRDLTGGAFIVVGDVSGKGLRAALTVSAIMGALRTMPDLEPSRILMALNRGLTGQLGGGFVTCCAITISADGAAVIANAGHLQPYCNGKEIELDCGLPLGILPSAEFTETRVRLAPTDRLTLITDGVLEARDPASGELFGFDRAVAISKQPAQNVAQAAQEFGQEDDITVLTLTFAQTEVLQA